MRNKGQFIRLHALRPGTFLTYCGVSGRCANSPAHVTCERCLKLNGNRTKDKHKHG